MAPLTNTRPPITMNCRYLGLATKIRQIAIPRMMIAVLKLLYATMAKMGRTTTITFTTVRNFPICFGMRLIIVARNKITASFAISDG